jgi:uroporphyrinogen decarboxylase
LVNKWLEIGVDMIGFHTDIGTQHGPMISPNSFRKHIKPLFMHLFQTIRRAGVHVYLSSDGNVLPIVDDLIECGISAHDPQLRANTLPGIVKAYRGKVFANVDLDRQGFPFCTPQQMRDQVKEAVDAMALPEGGMGLIASFYDNITPLANIRAVLEAMEDYCW